MLGNFKGRLHAFLRDRDGAAPIEIGAAVLAALAAAVGFVVMLDAMV